MIYVKTINVTPRSIKLQTGTWYSPTSVEVWPMDATTRTVTWSSNNTAVASVNASSGEVHANAEGTAIITARACDGSEKSTSYIVTVTNDILVTSLVVHQSKKTLDLGEDCYLSASVCPMNAANRCVCWTSSDTRVATVNSTTGNVVANGMGTAIIYAHACDGSGKSDSCKVIVGRHYRIINKNRDKALSVDGAYLIKLDEDTDVCLMDQDDSNEQIWRVSAISEDANCYINPHVDETFYLHANTASEQTNAASECKVSKMKAESNDRPLYFCEQEGGYYKIKHANSDRYLTVASSGTAVEWDASSDSDLQLWSMVEVDMEQREAEKVEYHILAYSDIDKALRVGDKNYLAMQYDVEKIVDGKKETETVYRTELQVFAESKSFWNRQKWTIKKNGSTVKIKSQLSDDEGREFFLCRKNTKDVYISRADTDMDFRLEIIPYNEEAKLYKIKLFAEDLYLTFLGENVSWETNNSLSNQIWKFETKPKYIHNGGDTSGKLYRSSDNDLSIRKFKLGNEEFVVRYYAEEQYSWKTLTSDEVNAIHDAGLSIVSVYQDVGNSAKYFSRELGLQDAERALELAETLGQTTGSAIYFAVDYNASNDMNNIREYFKAISEKLCGKYAVGIYGRGPECSEIKQNLHYADYSWLCQSTGTKGSENNEAYKAYDDPTKYNIKQADYIFYNGFCFDDDVAVGSDYGQW